MTTNLEGLLVSDPDLTAVESAYLILLMSQARAISNTELRERFGVTLDGDVLKNLQDAKYVESRKEGRALTHQLTDSGWSRCRRDLNFLGSASRPLGAALASMVGGLHRYLHAEDRSLADIFAPTPKPEPVTVVKKPAGPRKSPVNSLPARIRVAYDSLTKEPGGWVGLADLRALLADVDKKSLNAALRRMAIARTANIVPESNQKALTNADRLAAINIGGQDKHLIAIGV